MPGLADCKPRKGRLIRHPYASTYVDIDRIKVSTARFGNASVRTTIPAQVAVQLDLEAGSAISWKVDRVKGKWIAMMQRAWSD